MSSACSWISGCFPFLHGTQLQWNLDVTSISLFANQPGMGRNGIGRRSPGKRNRLNRR